MTQITIEAAHDLGTKGAEPSEAERLLFEAWMRGHCWALSCEWDGKQYTNDVERGGNLCPHAIRTRQLWAVWRDRAALGAQQTAERSVTVTVLSGMIESLNGLSSDAQGYHFKTGWNGALKQAMDCAQPAAQPPAEPWPVRGVRVEGDKVIIAVKGGNDAARWLCGEVLAKHTAQPGPDYAALELEHLGDPDKKTGIYEPMCFLQDTRSYVGNCPMWWQAGGGYTSRIDRAERFTIERALSQCKTRDTDRAWLCSDIEPLARPTIDHQEMRDIKPVPMAEHKKPDDTEGGEA